MLTFPNIDPVALSLGPLKIHWYGVMYLVAFGAAFWLGTRRANKPGSGWSTEQISDVVFYGALGTVLGGRLGYTLFYGMNGFISDPVSIFRVWEGGMSYHGGMLGVAIAMWLFGRKYKKSFFETTDFITGDVLPIVHWAWFSPLAAPCLATPRSCMKCCSKAFSCFLLSGSFLPGRVHVWQCRAYFV
jgi:prolipoprotein diacylglyceryl transferase